MQAARLPSIIQNGYVCGRIISIFENNDGKSSYPMGSRDTVKVSNFHEYYLTARSEIV